MIYISSESIWKKLNEDPKFVQELEPIREVTRRYVEALPSMPEEILRTPATFKALMAEKLKYMRYCVNNCFNATGAYTTPQESQGPTSTYVLGQILKNLLNHDINSIENQIARTTGLVTDNPIADEIIMLSSFIGLNQQAQALYLIKRLTIGNLWAIQPSVFIRS